MHSYFLDSVARVAIVVAMVFIVGKTIPSMPNKLWRFVFLFVTSVPFILVIDYVDAWLVGYSKTSWTWIFIFALLIAAIGTFRSAQSHKSDTA